MEKKRYLEKLIRKDLIEKMVFIGGPRQVGKTTLALNLGDSLFKSKFTYLNWDSQQDRLNIVSENYKPESKLLIFDEIHKYKNWKNHLKGIYDKHKNDFSILATGSARLDIYQKGGDSLMGRYYYFRLHPFSLAEIAEINSSPNIEKLNFSTKSILESYFKDLQKFGGFPEPLFKAKEENLRRWHNQRVSRLVSEDIRDATLVRQLSIMQIMIGLLPQKVASKFSINSLREDLQINHETISSWMDIFENFYYLFRIYPYNASQIKSLKKEPKLYLYDWSELNEIGKINENIVASHLKKYVDYLYDVHGYKAKLCYLRDATGREVDFLVTLNDKPWFAVEVKTGEKKVSKHLQYFCEKLKINLAFQLVDIRNVDQINPDTKIRVMSIEKFLSSLV